MAEIVGALNVENNEVTEKSVCQVDTVPVGVSSITHGYNDGQNYEFREVVVSCRGDALVEIHAGPTGSEGIIGAVMTSRECPTVIFPLLNPLRSPGTNAVKLLKYNQSGESLKIYSTIVLEPASV